MGSLLKALTSTLATLGTAQAQSPFQKCIKNALVNNADLYSFPQDLLYKIEDVHPYNLDHPIVPAVITYPESTEQVSDVVQCAHQAGIAVQARSGGHNYLNFGLGGVNGACVVDTKHLNDFTYDAQDGTILFGAGNRLRDLTKKLKPIGRAMAYGAAGDVGTGGHITIGGLGYLGRQLGLAADQIIKMECVLANGTIAYATATSNADLFFAMRGAGFSFAIVTEFKAQTVPAPAQVTQFAYNITSGRIGDLANSFKTWQKFVTQPNLPRTFASTLTLLEGMLVFSGTYFGSRAEFDKLNLQAILPNGQHGLDVKSHIVTNLFHDIGDLGLDLTGGIPAHFYSKNLKTTNKTLYSDQAADAVFDYIDKAKKGSPLWFVIWDLNGGKIAEPSQTATAYWHRDAVYFLQSYIVSLTGDVSKTSKDFLAGLNRVVQQQTGADDSAYPGYVDDELPDPQRSYWGGNVPRLERIKASLDPDNVFRNPQTIIAAKKR